MREIFEEIESRLEELDKKIVILLFIFLVVGVSVLFYSLSYSPYREELQNRSQKLQTLEQKVDKLSKSTLLSQIEKEENKIARINLEIDKFRARHYELVRELEHEHYRLTTHENFYKFLTDLLAKSIAYNIDIDKIELDPVRKKFAGELFITREMVIRGGGDFLNIVRLLRYAETNKLLFRTALFHVEIGEEYPLFEIKLQFFGDGL